MQSCNDVLLYMYVGLCMRVFEEICHSLDVGEGVTLLCHATVVKKVTITPVNGISPWKP